MMKTESGVVKKWLVGVLAFGMTLTALPGSVLADEAADDTAQPQPVYSIDFESGNSGKGNAKEDWTASGKGIFDVKDGYLEVTHNNGDGFATFTFRGATDSLVPEDSDFTLKYKVYFGGAATYGITIANGNSARGLSLVYDGKVGNLYVQHTDSNYKANNTAGGELQSVYVTRERWHDICITYDDDTGEGHLYLDGYDTGFTVYRREKIKGTAINSSSVPNRLYFGIEGTNSNGLLRVDDVEIYRQKLIITPKTEVEPVYNITFEEDNTEKGNVIDDWTTNENLDATIVGEDSNNHYLRLANTVNEESVDESDAYNGNVFANFRFRVGSDGDPVYEVPADSDFTIKYRARFDEVSNYGLTVSNASYSGLAMKYSDTRELCIQHNTSDTATGGGQKIKLITGKWHDVCIVYDKAKNEGHLYLDNIDTGYTVFNRNNVQGLTSLWFGVESSRMSGTMLVDDIRIYDRALTVDPIQFIMPEVTVDSGTVSVWGAIDAAKDLDHSYALFLAQYDENDQLLAVTPVVGTLAQAKNEGETPLGHGYIELTANDTITEGAAKVKVMFWNGVEFMMPYIDTIEKAVQ